MMGLDSFLPSQLTDESVVEAEKKKPKRKRTELLRLGYKKIIAKYTGLCKECGWRFPPETYIYWLVKRNGITHTTTTICENCVEE